MNLTTEYYNAPKESHIENFGFLSKDMWTLLSEGRVWLTAYLSCWGSLVRAKHITVWWSFSWGQHASLLHIHTALYIETRSDIPDHNHMKPTKRPPPVSFISVWIQAESIYFPLDIKFISGKIQLVQASAGWTHCLWKEQSCHNPISSVIRYFSFWADAFFPCFLKSNQHMVAWLWEWGQMFWQLNRGSSHARAHNICATTTDRRGRKAHWLICGMSQ